MPLFLLKQRNLVQLIFVSMLSALPAYAQDQSSEKAAPDTSGPTSPAAEVTFDKPEANAITTEAQLEPYSLTVALGTSKPVRDDLSASSTLDFTGRLELMDRIRLSIVQRFTRLYEIDPGESANQASDTKLRLSWKALEKSPETLDSALSLGAEASLPVSQFSREQKVRTVLGLTATASREFGPLTATLSPGYYFHVNKYKTLDKDDSGNTVIRSRLRIAATLGLKLPHDFSLSASSEWIERHYEDPPYGSHQPDHDYVFDGSLGYSLDRNTEFALGYYQGNRAEQLGTTDIFLYDVDTTEIYVSIARTFK